MKTINTEFLELDGDVTIEISPSYDGVFFEIVDGGHQLFCVIPDSKIDEFKNKIGKVKAKKLKAR